MKRLKRVLKWVGGALLVLVLALVITVEVLSRRRFTAPMPAVRASSDPAVIARGEYLVHAVAHCGACHLTSIDEVARIQPGDRPAMRGGFPFDTPFGLFRSPNITPDVETGVGRWSDAELARAIRHGVGRDGRLLPFMSFSTSRYADEDLAAIVSYLRSTAPVRSAIPPEAPNFIGRALMAFAFGPGHLHETPPMSVPAGVTVERGRYLALVAQCRGCHTHYDERFRPVGAEFSGGNAEPSEQDPAFELAPPNITPGGVIGPWSESGFIARFRAGRVYRDSHMAWESFRQMTDDDLRAIWRYLQTVPRVDRSNGPSRRRVGSYVEAGR